MGARSSQPRGPGFNKTDGHLIEYFRDNFILGRTSAAPPPPPGMDASGGAISDYSDPGGSGTVYRSHTFTASGAFTVNVLSQNPNIPDNIDVLSIGGGGAGGYGPAYGGGGGGAGGIHYRTGLSLPGGAATYPIAIGAGGGGAAGGASPHTGGTTSSPLVPFTAAGGGHGGQGDGTDGQSGASGGAGSYNGGNAGAATGAAGHPGGIDIVSPTPNANGWGNAGNTPPAGSGNNGDGSGGGGAGAAGAYQTAPKNAGTGGVGVRYTIVNGTATYYAGGGGGGAHNGPGGVPGAGGNGGGGAGGANPGPAAGNGTIGVNGTAGTGGGGGGAGNKLSVYTTTRGGSGLFVVRYQIASVPAQKATGGSISYFGGKTIHAFTSTGDFNNTTGADLTGCEVIILGGGGGGGIWQGGGGGAGRFYRNDDVNISPGPNPVTVGAGGQGSFRRPAGTPEINPGENGTDSVFNSVTMVGGGGGGEYGGNALAGGSGGGGAGHGSTYGPGGAATGGNLVAVTNTDTPTSGAGNAGGLGNATGGHSAAGGGGAGGVGANGADPGSTAGSGGLGIRLPSTFRNPDATVGYISNGVANFVGGGGGGGAGPPSSSSSGGGGGAPTIPAPKSGPDIPSPEITTYEWAGAGSGCADSSNKRARSGQLNSGSGGGGNGHGSGVTGIWGGNGGSGLVLVAYPT